MKFKGIIDDIQIGIIAALVLISAGCATGNHPFSAPSSDPMAKTTHSVDLIVRVVLTETFVKHANEAKAIDPTDTIFAQCVDFGLTLRDELITRPLIAKPNLGFVAPDLTCPLCVIEATRKNLELAETGALTAQLADQRNRYRDIKKRTALACGPLYMETTDVVGNVADLFGGFLGHGSGQ